MELYGVGIYEVKLLPTMTAKSMWAFLEKTKSAFKDNNESISVAFRAADVDIVFAEWFMDGIRLQAKKDNEVVEEAFPTCTEELEQVLTNWNALTVEQVRENWHKDEQE